MVDFEADSPPAPFAVTLIAELFAVFFVVRRRTLIVRDLPAAIVAYVAVFERGVTPLPEAASFTVTERAVPAPVFVSTTFVTVLFPRLTVAGLETVRLSAPFAAGVASSAWRGSTGSTAG